MNRLSLTCLLIFSLIIPGLESYAAEPDCEIILKYNFKEISEGKLACTDTTIIQINNRAGEHLCDVEIPFDKSSPITHFSAWIEDTTGFIIRKLRKQEYQDVSAISNISLYEDHFKRKFTLKHSTYPYRVCYTHSSVTRQFISIADWTPVADYDVPTRHATLVLKTPKDYRIRISEKNIDSVQTIQTNSGITRTWNASFDGSLEYEIFCPPLRDYTPRVEIEPLQFNYGCLGSMADWNSFGKWIHDLNFGLGNLPESEKLIISGLVGQTGDKNEIVKILYHYLQDNTRYVNVTLDIGGLKSYPAEYVAINKYGDCKALTNYMQALLEYAGITSYYTIIYGGRFANDIDPDFPSQKFNHVVLTVPLDEDTIWLENTSNSIPFGYAGTFIQNRFALMINGDQNRLIRVPSLLERNVLETSRAVFIFDTEGNAEASLHYDFRGAQFEDLNSLISSWTKDEINTYLHDHLSFPVFELKDWKIFKKDRDAVNISLDLDIHIPHLLSTIGDQGYFIPLSASIPEFASPKNRRLPVQLPYPVYQSDTLVYQVPSFFNSIKTPPDNNLESKFGRYRVRYSRVGSRLTIFREFLLHSGKISLDEYCDFYNFLSAIKKDENQKIIIKRK